MAKFLWHYLMTLFEFTKLSIEEQSDAVFEKAIPICTRKDGKCHYILYALYSFYIERKYDHSKKILLDMIAFDISADTLDLYLNQILLPTEINGNGLTGI